MHTRISFIKGHPLGIFFSLTFVISWAAMALWLSGDGEAIPWFTFGPLLAALVVTTLVTGRDGLKELLRRQVSPVEIWQNVGEVLLYRDT